MSEVLDLLDENAALLLERQPFENIWDDIERNLLPNITRLSQQSNNSERGERRDEAIIEGTPRFALSTFQAGMMGRLMSATSDWLSVQTPDEDMMDDRDTRMWLSKVNAAIFSLISRSNFYTQCYPLFGVAGGIGTGTIYRDFDLSNQREVFSLRNPYEICFAEDPSGEVDTAFRITLLSYKRIAQEFKDDVVDKEVSRMASSSTDKHQEIQILHAVKPNPNYNPKKRDKLNKKYLSFYVDIDHELIMRRGGYAVFPYASWRIDKEVNERYGRGPGWRALADIKALYAYAKTDITAAQLNSNPALDVPEERMGKVKYVPGGRNPYEDASREVKRTGGNAPDPRFGVEREQRKQQIIERHFMVPFFTMMQQIGGMQRERTAYEVRQIEQEMAILIGPYAMGFQSQFMDSIVEGLFYDVMDNRMVPPPPPQLVNSMNGRKLEVVYSGPWALSVKSFFNSEPYRKTLQDIQAMMSTDPTGQSTPRQIMQIPDWDRFAKELFRSNGLPEESMLEDRKLATMRKAIQDQIERQRQLDALQKAGGVDALNKPMEPGSMLDQVSKASQGQPVASGQ